MPKKKQEHNNELALISEESRGVLARSLEVSKAVHS